MLHGVLNMPPELWNNDSPIALYIDELERELTAAREEGQMSKSKTPHLRHRWHDGALFIDTAKKIQWRLQWCKCGKERVKPKSKQPTEL